MTIDERTLEAEKVGLDRIIFFSDAVIAIAMTLMALEIQVPETVDVVDLVPALYDVVPTLIAYAVSFLVVAIYWIEHHRMFRYIRRYDAGLIWINFLFLILIVLVPFPTDLLDRYTEETLTVVLYAVQVSLIGLVVALLWWYASRNHRLVDADLDENFIRKGVIIRVSMPLVFILSIPIAMVNPTMAIYSWVAVFPVIFGLNATI